MPKHFTGKNHAGNNHTGKNHAGTITLEQSHWQTMPEHSTGTIEPEQSNWQAMPEHNTRKQIIKYQYQFLIIKLFILFLGIKFI